MLGRFQVGHLPSSASSSLSGMRWSGAASGGGSGSAAGRSALPDGGAASGRFVVQAAEFDDIAAGRRLFVPRGGQLLQIGPSLFDLRRIQLPLPGGIGQQQGVIAHLVDQPRHAVGGLVDALAGFGGKDSRAVAAGGRNLRMNVILRLRCG